MDTTTQIRAAIYTRISDDQTGQRAGVTRQLEDCEALAERLNLTVVRDLPGMNDDGTHFDDNDLSAFTGKTRPGFEAMLDGLKRGVFTAVICWHPDRLYRSLKDLGRLTDIAGANGALIRTVNGGDIDLSNATGIMLAQILGSVAEQESRHKGERQRRANTARRVEGRWCAFGLAPFGYEKVRTADLPPHDERRRYAGYTIVPVEPAASMVVAAAADVLTGASLRSIVRDFNSRGITTSKGQPWRNITLRYLLTNPVYAALVTEHAGGGAVVGVGDWEPILDRATHDGLVAKLHDPARKTAKYFERRHRGSGVYECGVCGAKLYANYIKRPPSSINPDRYQPIYRCKGPDYDMPGLSQTTNHLAVDGEGLDLLVESVVLAKLAETDIRARLAVDAPDVDVDELRTRRAAATARADELARMFAARAIDGSQLGSGTAALRAEIAGIDRILAQLVASSPALALLDGDPDELVSRWDAASADIKGKVICELFTVTVNPARRGYNRFDPDRIVFTPKI